MKARSWAFVLPWCGCALAGGVSPSVTDALGDPGLAAGPFFVLGLFLGWAWTRLYPRPLVERLFVAATWICFIVALLFLLSLAPGSETTTRSPDDLAGAFTLAGIFVALVFVERKRVDSPTT